MLLVSTNAGFSPQPMLLAPTNQCFSPQPMQASRLNQQISDADRKQAEYVRNAQACAAAFQQVSLGWCVMSRKQS
jgi:hypothetical protein